MAGSTAAFLALLQQPLNCQFKPSSSSCPPKDRCSAPHDLLPDHDVGELDSWIEATISAASSWVYPNFSVCHSSSAVSQLALSLCGAIKAYSFMCSTSPSLMKILGVSEDALITQLAASPSSKSTHDSLATDSSVSREQLQKLKAELIRQETLITTLEQKVRSSARVLDTTTDQRRREEEKSSALPVGAMIEIAALCELLADERRANLDLVRALDALRSSGTDTSRLEEFLIKRAPELQREAYLDAKSSLLKKILVKYPNADMDYFSNLSGIPEEATLSMDWLEVPDDRFVFPSSFSAPPLLLSRKRKRQL